MRSFVVVGAFANRRQRRLDALLGQQRLQPVSLRVTAGEATDVTRAPSCARFMATLAAPPGLSSRSRGAHHRHRRLGRDALHLAPDVLVEHHVADDQHRDVAPARLDQGHDLTQSEIIGSTPAFSNWLIRGHRNVDPLAQHVSQQDVPLLNTRRIG